MAWNNLIGLEKEKKIFQKVILEEKLADAYCFLGLEGIGKDAFALELAKTANCYNPIISGETISACDNCKSCQMANNMTHRNIQIVFAQPAADKLTEKQIEEIRDQMAQKIEDPYHRISIANARYISINSIRNIKKKLAFSETSGRQFIIISNGEDMNIEAANAFLKTLEEPRKNTTIIITSSHREKLLQTILSRCQQVYFSSLELNDIQNYLEKKYKKNNNEARLIAAMSQGSITRALDYLDDDMNSLRNFSVDLLRIALRRKNYRMELIEAIEQILGEKDKQLNVLFLNIFAIWLKDVYSVLILRNTSNVVNIDLLDRTIKFSNGFQEANYLEAFNLIEKTIARLNQNVDPTLAYLSLFIELRKIFTGLTY